MEIKKVAVLGAGLMGHGIAQVAAQVAKYEVALRDVKQEFLDNGMNMIRGSLQKFLQKGVVSEKDLKATLGRIHPTLDLKEAVADAGLVIEAVPERIELKKSVLKEVDGVAKKDVIIASNTSSISITELASATKRPERFCGMHFFNPPQLMKLVEIIRGAKTSDATVDTIVKVSENMGKETVVVKKDSAGFIVNRILIPALNEAMYLVWEGIAEPEDIDKAIRLGLNWPMGPLRLLDYLGLDTTLSIAEVLRDDLDPKYRPCPLLRQMVRANLLGRKAGRGFYDWTKK
ncbi:MAG: 3-hydroxyacyl-CoA dehydrogenase family protein [Candidatus Bathyarchaeia archaeon]